MAICRQARIVSRPTSLFMTPRCIGILAGAGKGRCAWPRLLLLLLSFLAAMACSAMPDAGAAPTSAGTAESMAPTVALQPVTRKPLPPPPSLTPQTANALAEDAAQFISTLLQRAADASFHTPAWSKTVRDLNRSLELDPVGVDRYADAAWLLWSSGKYDEALDFYHRMIMANPQNPEAFFELGWYYDNTLKNDTEAVKWLERAEALGLKSPKRHLYGHVLTRLGRTNEALAFWRKVLADDPKDEVAQRSIDELTHPSSPPGAGTPATPAATVPSTAK